jgi:hypothetical protein
VMQCVTAAHVAATAVLQQWQTLAHIHSFHCIFMPGPNHKKRSALYPLACPSYGHALHCHRSSSSCCSSGAASSSNCSDDSHLSPTCIHPLTWLVRCVDTAAARHTAPCGTCACLLSDTWMNAYMLVDACMHACLCLCPCLLHHYCFV